MKKEFGKLDFEVGQVIKLRRGIIYMVMCNKFGKMCFARSGGFMDLDSYNYLLNAKSGNREFDIIEVYDRPSLCCFTAEVSTENRELLWKREEEKPAKKMTVSEIEKILGYKVEVVADADKSDN